MSRPVSHYESKGGMSHKYMISLVMLVLWCQARPLRMFFTVPGTMGIAAANQAMLLGGSLFLIFFWAMFTQSPNMHYWLYFTILVQVDHWWKTKRRGVHSYSGGTALLLRSFHTEQGAWRATNCLMLAVGWVISEEFEPAFGHYVMAAAVANVLIGMHGAYLRNKDDDAVQDAYLEQAARGRRLQQHRQ